MTKQWIAALLALWSLGAHAEDQLCAVVLIEIAQEATFERQGFEATMRINNGLDSVALSQLKIQVSFEDDSGHVVKASSDPDATDASFFIRLDDSQNVDTLQSGADGALTNGVIAAKASGVLRWVIIPTAGAAGTSLGGKRYNVGASLSYNAGGKVESLSVAPDTITVKPQPQLTLDYFLTKEIIADDAFTSVIEPPEPYTLGIRIRNSGRAAAQSVKLESSQPHIVGNDMGLAINFKITQSFVDEAPAAPTLLLDFGTIAPSRNRVGRWLMESSLSGRFIDFSASFSHPDELGGRMTSLVEATNAHFLVHDVLVDLANRDGIRDFLAFVGDDLYVFESDSTGQASNAPCQDCTAVKPLVAQLSSGAGQLTLSVTPQAGFGFIKVRDPFSGSKGLQRVARADGRTLSASNAWLSKERAADGRSFDYYLNVFDTQPASSYSVDFGELSAEPRPPVFMPVADRSIQEGGQVGFLVRASDPNGTVPALSVANLPSGATFVDRGQGEGAFNWLPQSGQAGHYVVNFKASDGRLETTLPVGITVLSPGDSGSGGGSGGNTGGSGGNSGGGSGSGSDGSGGSGADDTTPLPPTLLEPALNAHVALRYPALRVTNSTTRLSKGTLSYWFELYEDAAMSSLLAKSAAVEEGSRTTEWLVKAEQLPSGKELLDNHRYYWRVKVSSPKASSVWLNGSFFIDTANDAPSAPLLLKPTPMGLVADLKPVFSFNNSQDVDEDAITYNIVVYAEQDENFQNPVVKATGIAAGEGGVTSWHSPENLEEGKFYFWRVDAIDARGAITPSEPSLFGVSLANKPPTAPGLAWPTNGQRLSRTQGLTLRLEAATDPERQPLKYRIQGSVDTRFAPESSMDSGWFTAQNGVLQWSIPATLVGNQTYYWRAQASDGQLESDWRVGSFYIEPEGPPATPVVDNPGQNAWVDTPRPPLSLHAVSEGENQVGYEIELYNGSGSQLLAARKVLVTSWTPEQDLPNHSWYSWRARAVDGAGRFSPWTDSQRFYVNQNTGDQLPGVRFIYPVKDLRVAEGAITFQWETTDPQSAAVIDIYANTTQIAKDLPVTRGRYTQTLNGIPAGSYQIRAVVRDASGMRIIDSCCSITVAPASPKVQVRPLDRLDVDEQGEAVATFDVSLTEAPASGGSLTLDVSLDDPGEARLLNDKPYLHFDSSNWSQPQRIYVQGVDDCKIDGDRSVALRLAPQANGDQISDIGIRDILLVNKDNEVPGQKLFVCDYQIVSRTATPSNPGMVDIVVRPELRNLGEELAGATASVAVNGGDIRLSAHDVFVFGKASYNQKTPAGQTLTVTQPANIAPQLGRLRWTITAGTKTQ